MNKLSAIDAMIMAALMSQSSMSNRPLITHMKPEPELKDYPVGREVMLECGIFAHPVRVKAVTNGMLKVEARLLGKINVGDQAFLNPGHFVVHRVSQSTLMLRPA